MTSLLKRSHLFVALMLALTASTAAAGDKRGVRFKASYDGVFSPPELVSFDPPIVFLTSTVTGRATKLGKYHGSFPHFINLADGTFHGTLTFTRRKTGEQLVAEITGTAIPISESEFSISLTGTFTGGTGRFVDASGTFTGTGTANLATLSTSQRFKGRLILRKHGHGHGGDHDDDDHGHHDDDDCDDDHNRDNDDDDDR
jgi:hypothetical protein